MKRQQGLGMIAAIVILVILAALAGAIVSFSTTQHMSSAQDVVATRVWQAAKSGNEWGLYQALKTGGGWYSGAASDPCPAGLGVGTQKSQSWADDTGFGITVTAQCWKYNEGEASAGTPKVVRLYRITSTACNASACPAADASGAGYVERTRTVIATY